MQVQTMVASVRKNPDDRAELVTQATLGTKVKLKLNINQWSHITVCPQKDYPGWVKKKNICFCPDYSHKTTVKIKEMMAPLKEAPLKSANTIEEAVFQAELVFIKQNFNWFFVEGSFGKKCWVNKDYVQYTNYNHNNYQAYIIKTAKKFLGTPYLWGGLTPYGIDCSGLIYIAFASAGFYLHRDSHLQYDIDGSFVDKSNLEMADLVFFDTMGRGTITHVGIYMQHDYFIHASSQQGKVVIDHLDNDSFPIFYRGAKRIISNK